MRSFHVHRAARIAAVVMAAGVGATAGVGGFTFLYANGGSYLSNDPAACVNCHVMQPQFDAWVKGPHRQVATCNDCHAPHDIVGKLWVKARNGYNHSMAFTLGGFHEPIRITEPNRRVTEQACRDCHEAVVHAIDFGTEAQNALRCLHCHAEVGHAD